VHFILEKSSEDDARERVRQSWSDRIGAPKGGKREKFSTEGGKPPLKKEKVHQRKKRFFGKKGEKKGAALTGASEFRGMGCWRQGRGSKIRFGQGGKTSSCGGGEEGLLELPHSPKKANRAKNKKGESGSFLRDRGEGKMPTGEGETKKVHRQFWEASTVS